MALYVSQAGRVQEQGGQDVEEAGRQGTHTITSSPTCHTVPHPSPRVHEECQPEPVDLVRVVGVRKWQETAHICKAVHLWKAREFPRPSPQAY